VPADLAGDRLAVGIEQQLGRVAAMTAAWFVRPVDPVGVVLARAHVRQIAMPDEAVHLGQRNSGFGTAWSRAARIEQAQFDLLGNFRKQREVRS
jgi:hypothetical protein